MANNNYDEARFRTDPWRLRSHAAEGLGGDPNDCSHRRTPGLRREEVAARTRVSVTWYAWLEQGRGGLPSDEVLEWLSDALELDVNAREVMSLLARRRAPRSRRHRGSGNVANGVPLLNLNELRMQGNAYLFLWISLSQQSSCAPL